MRILLTVLALQETVYLPGDFAIRRGDYGREMFFIRIYILMLMLMLMLMLLSSRHVGELGN